MEEQLGGSGLNLLINNAGIVKMSTLDGETLENMIQVYTTNTAGPLLLGQVRPSPKLGCAGGTKGWWEGVLPLLQCLTGSWSMELMEPQAGGQELEPDALGQWEREGGCSSAGANVATVEGAGPLLCLQPYFISFSPPRRSCPC